MAAHAFFGLLLLLNAVRIARHALWRDEAQAFLLALHAGSPLELFHELHYEGHPGLWPIALWGLTHFTANPAAMQALQFAIGLGIWLLIYRCAPFHTAEKFLLLLSYYLFFEYFVLSRGYGLMALVIFGYVVLRRRRPQDFTLAWLTLGVMANTEVFAAIWSMALALALAVEQRTKPRGLALGAAMYLGLFALSVTTMKPAPDLVPPPGFGGGLLVLGFSRDRLEALVSAVAKAFLPLDAGWLSQRGAAGAAPWPPFMDPSPLHVLTLRPDLVLPAILGASLIAAGGLWLLLRDRRRAAPSRAMFTPVVASFGLGWLGVLLFLYVFRIPVATRYVGILFLMAVAAAWQARYERPGRAPRWWIALLALNALAGIYSLRSEFVPFSDSRRAANWIERNHLDRAFLVAYQDWFATPVAAYLEQPFYGLQCRCNVTEVVYDVPRPLLDAGQILRRTRVAMTQAGRTEAILLVGEGGLGKIDRATAPPGLAVTLLKRFPAAAISTETFSLYRLGALPP